MDKWSETFYARLDSKRTSIPKNEFRFLSIGRITLLAARTGEHSVSCSICQDNKKVLEYLVDSLPGCLGSPHERRSWERKKHRIEQHLRKGHGIRPAHYYYALYTFAGLLTGMATGLLSGILITGNVNINLLLGGSAAGLIIGQIVGKRTDRQKYKKNMQI